MNTRLQVEHPVTEAVTGFDLVEWQLQVASGQALPVTQANIKINGHAVEARLYAEDVDAGFLPATGTLSKFVLADQANHQTRVDTGVREGDVVQPFYDPMLAKLITHAPNRLQAFQQLHRSLRSSIVLGATTNRAFLARLCQHSDVLAGKVHTGLIEDEVPDVTSAGQSGITELMPDISFEMECNAALAAIMCIESNSRKLNAAHSAGVYRQLGVWQLWGKPERQLSLQNEQDLVQFAIRCESPTLWHVSLDPHFAAQAEQASVVERFAQLAGDGITVELQAGEAIPGNIGNGLSVNFNDQSFFSAALDDGDTVHTRVAQSEMRFNRPLVELSDGEAANAAQLLAPMPGRIIAVEVAPGEQVSRGDVLVTLEAMKMEHNLEATTDAQIESVLVAVGDQVEQGARLVQFEVAENGSSDK